MSGVRIPPRVPLEMKKNILICLFFITISLFADNTNNTLTNTTDLNIFLNQTQNVYYLNIHENKKLKVILTGETIFEPNINIINSHSCIKIIFW